MIDCHAHIFDSSFDGDREQVLIRARQAGVKAVIAEDRYAPSDADITAIIALIRENRKELVAIGEVGLDYRVATSEMRPLQQQALAFRDTGRRTLFIDTALIKLY